jgi:hypothetical protein
MTIGERRTSLVHGGFLMAADVISRLQAGINQARPAIAAAGRAQYEGPTPCPEWDVRQLINHMLVHSWDLAKATGQTVDWDSQLVAETTAFCRATFDNPQFRGADFGPPVEVGDGASDMDRLVAFLGRQP